MTICLVTWCMCEVTFRFTLCHIMGAIESTMLVLAGSIFQSSSDSLHRCNLKKMKL